MGGRHRGVGSAWVKGMAFGGPGSLESETKFDLFLTAQLETEPSVPRWGAAVPPSRGGRNGKRHEMIFSFVQRYIHRALGHEFNERNGCKLLIELTAAAEAGKQSEGPFEKVVSVQALREERSGGRISTAEPRAGPATGVEKQWKQMGQGSR